MSLLADRDGAQSDDTTHPMPLDIRGCRNAHQMARAGTRGTRVQPDFAAGRPLDSAMRRAPRRESGAPTPAAAHPCTRSTLARGRERTRVAPTARRDTTAPRTNLTTATLTRAVHHAA